jgi:DHA2 family multidrug resistance protein
MFGLALFALSMWEFAPITHDWGARELLFPQALRGAAQQLSVAPTVVLTLGSLPPLRLKLASGLFNTMRNLGGAIGIALCATILNDRTNLHFQRLADHLNYTNEAMDGWIATTATRLGTMDAQAVLRPLWQVTYREAQTLAYSDAFLVIMCGFVVATLLVPLMRKVAPPSQPSADGH